MRAHAPLCAAEGFHFLAAARALIPPRDEASGCASPGRHRRNQPHAGPCRPATSAGLRKLDVSSRPAPYLTPDIGPPGADCASPRIRQCDARLFSTTQSRVSCQSANSAGRAVPSHGSIGENMRRLGHLSGGTATRSILHGRRAIRSDSSETNDRKSRDDDAYQRDPRRAQSINKRMKSALKTADSNGSQLGSIRAERAAK